MPRRDRTGPMGVGAMTGRDLGLCTNASGIKCGVGLGLGLGFACRHGFGRGFGKSFSANQTIAKTKKESLLEQKNLLQSRLNVIDKQLENL